IYAAQGFRRFVLCTGYLGELIKAFAADTTWPAGTDVVCADTGQDTPTGGRVLRAREHVGAGPFACTYADGVADIALSDLVAHHRAHGALATVTVVRPRLQFGIAELDGGDRILGFHEKPRSDHWINGGFFCFEPGVFDYLSESSVLEREPLEGLAGDGQLRAYRHTGFWECMDTYKDAIEFNDLWAEGEASWKVWA
ncbi:MAG: sugar phosphate nucleotidyltransferase, partial [Solirubrobacteraceae bacterium]